jgi:hypothetical protein
VGLIEVLLHMLAVYGALVLALRVTIKLASRGARPCTKGCGPCPRPPIHPTCTLTSAPHVYQLRREHPMSDEKRQTKVPQRIEKRDANTVAAVVSAGASVVSAGAAVYAAHQSSKPKPPPKKDT